jgi:hypothetical protein
MTSVQDRAAGLSAPSSGSDADPANEITWPTAHVLDDDGRVIVGVGGLLPDVPGPKTWASQNEYVYGVPRAIPCQRTNRALTAANDVSFHPAPDADTDTTSVNDTPSVDTWNLYDDANAASQFNATRSTCRTDPKSTCHH